MAFPTPAVGSTLPTPSRSWKFIPSLLAFALLVNGAAAFAALPRYPQAYDGKIVFGANEHLWTVPRSGGTAVQLTKGPGTDVYPRVSPDGRWIAYTGMNNAGSDVWVIPAAGGNAMRLTYHNGRGLDNIVVTWSPDSRYIVYLSQHTQWNRLVRELYRVPVAGGLPEAMPLDNAVGMATYGPDGHTIAYNRLLTQSGNWKRYDGGMSREVFTYDFETRELRRLTDWAGINGFPMWYGRKIYYLSDQDSERRANIWMLDLDTNQRRQVTHFTDYDIDTPALGDNAITFQQGGKLYRLDLPNERLGEVKVSLPGDNPRTMKRTVAVKDLVRGAAVVRDGDLDLPDRVNYALAPDGRHSLFSARGELFSVPTQDGRPVNLTNSAGVEEDAPAWSPDNRTVAYVTEVDGARQVAVRSVDGGPERLLTHFEKGYFFTPVFAPDGRSLSFSDGEHRLWLIGMDGGAPRQVAQDKRQGIHDQVFSPDGRWLAFSMAATAKRRDLYLYEIATGRTHRLAKGEGNDANPAWSPDGKRLYFTSARHVNAVPSDQEIDFAMVKSTGIYAIHLPDSTEIMVPENLMAQAVAVPVEPGNIVQLDARKGRLYYLTQPIPLFNGVLKGEKPTLHRFDIDTEKDSVVAEGLDSYSLSLDGEKVLVKQGDDYSVLDAEPGAAAAPAQRLDLDRLRVTVDPSVEWAQMFHHAWRLQRDLFVSPTMNGQNWDAVRVRYAKLLPLLGSRSDLNWLLGEMLGELSNSHMYVGGGDDGHAADTPDRPRLGVDWALDRNTGRYKLAKIHAGDNTLREYRSPLRQPGLPVKAGNYVLAINGMELRAPMVPDALLQGLNASSPVDLDVADSPQGTRRHVRVQPVVNEMNLRELAWIEHNRETVDRLSSGRVGYVYLADMGQRGLEQFTRQFYAQLNRQALILDVRWNGGGSVADYMIERLRRTQAAFNGNRTGAMDTQPQELGAGPKVVLINRWTGSNGELFPYLFQQYGLGQAVGTRTWGGLRGYNGNVQLIDGGFITIPSRAVYGMQRKEVVENHGVDPDVVVENMPADLLAGHDAQLETAVKLMIEAIDGQPNRLPDQATAESRQ
ncbi:S41 family peptidase [Massilia sp.]|uniref:S41 family peptidase n=1 Tax=Massilia sp. TaxID=1882437 RepID=UPI00289950EB|nr:S41 family peptidase [Massilia sp.]